MINLKEKLNNLSNLEGNYIYEKKDNVFLPITYKLFVEKVNNFARYLLNQGFSNKNILVYSENSINYMIADLAISTYVGVSVNVPFFYENDELEEIINDLNISCIIYSNHKNIDRIIQKYSNVKFICIQDLDNFILTTNEELNVRNFNDCSKIFFSSGTTSKPKAVMLSLKNIFAGWNSLCKRVNFTKDDIDYLYLPLSHTYGNIYNFMYTILSGMKIYLAADIKDIFEDMKLVKPTVFSSVPYVYLKALELKKDLNEIFGPNIKYLFAGGSQLSIEAKQKYFNSGLFIYDAYALTETASSLAISYNDSIIDNSVGTIFEDIDVKIYNIKDGIGEIIVKGDNVFLGYANNFKYTKEVFDSKGYFHTGDLGYIKDNRLYIVGRKKKILITSKGENIDIDKINKIILEMSNNFKKTRIYLNMGKIIVDIYIEKNNDYDIKSLLKKINDKLLKPEQISQINLKIDKRLKKN